MQKQQQIPCGNDSKKGKSNGKNNSGFPVGMTDRKATARAFLLALA